LKVLKRKRSTVVKIDQGGQSWRKKCRNTQTSAFSVMLSTQTVEDWWITCTESIQVSSLSASIEVENALESSGLRRKRWNMCSMITFPQESAVSATEHFTKAV